MPTEDTASPQEAPQESGPSGEGGPGSPSRRRFVQKAAAGLAGAWLASQESPAQAEPQAAPQAPTPANSSAPSSSPGRAREKSGAGSRRAVSNRAPLRAIPFYALPLGSVEARGWLLRQLELQRDGLTGHAEEILPAAKQSAWKGGAGEDWEKGPYYLKGLIPLAYTLGDDALKARAQAWVEPILASQREDGFFGPTTNDDWWPRMVVTHLLRDYHEATGDPRVLPFLSKYFRHMSERIGARPLRDWGRARAGDEIDTVFWLYNRTGEEFLLPLADVLYQQAYPWRDIFSRNRFLDFGQDFHPKHNVNVPQALKMPPVYWQRSGSEGDRAAFAAGVAHLMRDHGLAVGINSGTEFLAGRSTTQGIETCSTVERMLSDALAVRILGDASAGDNWEEMAFNALPASLSPSLRQHVYFTLPNNVTAPRSRVGFTQDYENARTPSPISGYPCCCYNLHMGWPKLAQNAWAATASGGLALLAYVPSQVLAEVEGGATARVVADTEYPFEETVRLRFEEVSSPMGQATRARFALVLRVPGWCEAASLTVNGKAQPRPKPGTFATIEREWRAGDVVTATFPMEVRTVEGMNGSVSVHRGPLLYSLAIGEEWKPFGEAPAKGFESFEVTPRSPWNYALALDERDPASSFTVQKAAQRPASTWGAPGGAATPFGAGQSPVSLRVRARRLPEWGLSWNGATPFDPPQSPVAASSPVETVTLVPFGSQMLRLASFPVAATAAQAAAGRARPAQREFLDRFEDGHSDSWVTYGGGWRVKDGAFGPSPDAPSSKAVASATEFADLALEADVAVGEAGDAGLLFRLSRPSIGDDAHQAYYVGLSPASGQVVLGKAQGKWTPLKSAPKALAPNTAHRVRVEARGPQIRVFVGDMGQPLLEASDSSFARGAIGVRQYGAKPEKPGATFTNITATAL